MSLDVIPNPNSLSKLFPILLDPKSFQTALDSVTWLPGHVSISYISSPIVDLIIITTIYTCPNPNPSPSLSTHSSYNTLLSSLVIPTWYPPWDLLLVLLLVFWLVVATTFKEKYCINTCKLSRLVLVYNVNSISNKDE